MPVFTSSPSFLRWSATSFEVRTSRLLSSGFWWMSRRHAITLLPTFASASSSCCCVTSAEATLVMDRIARSKERKALSPRRQDAKEERKTDLFSDSLPALASWRLGEKYLWFSEMVCTSASPQLAVGNTYVAPDAVSGC